MANLINLLSQTLEFLGERPSLFLPRIFSTLVGAAWFILLAEGAISVGFLALTGPFVALIGLFSSVMMADMVRNRDQDSLLLSGFLNTCARIADLLKFLGLLFLVGVVIYIPTVAGLAVYMIYGGKIYAVLGVSVSVFLLFATVFFGYFVPIALVEKGSVLSGVKASASTSIENSREVVALTLISFVLLGAVSLIGNSLFRATGYAVFVLLRLVSSLVSAYFLVVSPRYYLESD